MTAIGLVSNVARRAKQQGTFCSAVGLCAVILLSGSKSAFATQGNAQPVAPMSSMAANMAMPAPIVGLPSGVGNVSTSPVILTYQAWKSLRTDEARLILERMTLEGQIFAASGASGADRAPGERQAVVRVASTANSVANSMAAPMPRSSPRAAARPRQDNRVEQARMNLEIAQDLTINDYLQIYLSQFKSPEVLRDVARRMNPDEVAELLIAYQKTASTSEFANTDSASSSRLCSGSAR